MENSENTEQGPPRPAGLPWVNPYRLMVGDFPGRLFPFGRQAKEEIREIRRIAAAASEVYVEIGSGSGGHLLSLAKDKHEAAFFGFEIRYKRSVRTLQKAEVHQIPNAYVIRARGELLAEIFPPKSIAGVYVNFPDPWPKERERKNRILSPQLLDLLELVLLPGGFLSAKSDDGGYLDSFKQMLKEDERYSVAAESDNLYSSPLRETNIPTEFEQLFLSRGLPIHFVKGHFAKRVSRGI